MTIKETGYPSSVCMGCGMKACKINTGKEVFIYRRGKCGVCGKETAVTDPLNYGYPNFTLIENDKK